MEQRRNFNAYKNFFFFAQRTHWHTFLKWHRMKCDGDGSGSKGGLEILRIYIAVNKLLPQCTN